jgi:hypothetical protein
MTDIRKSDTESGYEELRFAYTNKRGPKAVRFGLLQAVDMKDARDWLGSGFRIRKAWIDSDRLQDAAFDRDKKKEIVSKVFLDIPAQDSTVW